MDHVDEKAFELMDIALGCTATCGFCRRKCQLAKHSDELEHNCDRLGH